MKLKKITAENIQSIVNDLLFIENKLKSALNKNERDTREYICKKYINIQNVSKVADELNEEGHRIKDRKYIGKDISEIINGSKDSEITIVAKAIFQYNNTLQRGKKSITKLIQMLKLGDRDESRANT